MSFQTIRKSFVILTVSTIVCRIIGLFREVVTARFFGTSTTYDAFLIAFMIPNFFRGILAEGALSTAFIPVLSEYVTDPQKKSEVREICSAVFTFLLFATVGLYVVVLGLSAILLHFQMLPPKMQPIFSLLRFTFPYLILVALAAWGMGILNAYHHFLLPGLNPIVLDAFWIGTLWFFVRPMSGGLDRQIVVLAIGGVIVGGVFQALFQVPAVVKRGIPVRLNWNWRHPALKRMLLLISPMVIGMSVGPINLLVDYSFARSLSEGMVSALWYATRVYQLPLGIFGVSLATVLLPHLSAQAARNEGERFGENLNQGLLQIFFLMIPSAAWMALYRTEVVEVLFRRGLFTPHSVDITAFALLFFCIGLAFYAAAMIVTRGFYAFHDTRTPVKIGVVSIVSNALLDYVLMKPLGQGGIALSTSLVGIENFLLLHWFFVRKYGHLETKSISAGFVRILLLTAGWSIILQALRGIVPGCGPLFTVGFGALVGIALYLGLAEILGFPEIAGWKRWKQ